MSMSPSETATQAVDGGTSARNDDDDHAEMLHTASSVIANAKKVFGSSSLPVSFGKYDSFYSSLRDSEIDQRQRHLESMERMRQYRGDGTCPGSRGRRENRNRMQHIEGEEHPYPIAEDAPPSPTADEYEEQTAGSSVFMSKVNFPGLVRTPLRNSPPSREGGCGVPSEAEAGHGSAIYPVAPMKLLSIADSLMGASSQSPEPNVSKQPLHRGGGRRLPVATPSPPVSGRTQSTPYEGGSESAMPGQSKEEVTVDTLSETIHEHELAPTGIRNSVRRMSEIVEELKTITDPYAHCSPGAMAGQDEEEVEHGSPNEPVEEDIAAALGVEITDQEHNLHCKDDSSKCYNDESRESERDRMSPEDSTLPRDEDNELSEVSPRVLAREILELDGVDVLSENTESGQGMQKETCDTLHNSVDEHIAAAPGVEVGLEEEQLECKDHSATFDSDQDGKPGLDKMPSSNADVHVDVYDVPSREISEINTEDMHSKSFDTEDQCVNLEAEVLAQGTSVRSMEEEVALPSFESTHKAQLITTDHIESENREAQAGGPTSSAASAKSVSSLLCTISVIEKLHKGCESIPKQVHNRNEFENKKSQEEEHNESVIPNKAIAPLTNPITTELDNDLPKSSFQPPETKSRNQTMPQEDARLLSVPAPSTPAPHDRESAPNTENIHKAMPLEQKSEPHLKKPPSRSSGRNAKSTSWKRKPKKGLNMTPLKRQKLDEILRKQIESAKNPWGTGVQLYNGRSVERVNSFKKCKNKFCQWEPRAHSLKAACERCWMLASRWEREEFIANGRHLRIAMVKGGCPPKCTLYPVGGGVASSVIENESRKAREEAVRLCRRCFDDVHYVGIR